MEMVCRKIQAIWILLSVAGVLRGQTTGYSLGDFNNTFLGSRYGKIVAVPSGINGSPYEKEDFYPGDIYTVTRQHYTGIPLRYNIYSGQMEFRKPDDGIYEVNHPENIDSILIGGSKYIYTSYRSGNNFQKGFLKVLTEGTPALLLRMNVIFEDAVPPALYKDAVPPRYDRTHDEFLLSFPGKEAFPFSGKKELLDILPAHQEKMDQFVRTNRIRFSRQEDLVRLLNFYYSLASGQ